MNSKTGLLATLTLSALMLNGCSAKLEAPSDPIFSGQFDNSCPTSYAPIALDNPAANVADLKTIEKSGTLSYAGAEFYYEIANAATIGTQVHARQAAGGNSEYLCSTHKTEQYPSGTDFLVEMKMPISQTSAGSEEESFTVNATDSYVALYTQGGVPTSLTMSELLLDRGYSDARFYDLGGNRFELRVVANEILENGFTARKSIVVRYNYSAN